MNDKREMGLKLVRPAMEYAEQVMHFKEEMLSNNDSLDGCSGLEDVDSFSEWIDFENRLKQKYGEGYVPSEVFLAVRVMDEKVVGIIDYRHPLSPFLLQHGGNIGYSVLPSERRNGYASEMLRLLLPICREYGEKRVLLTCDKGNDASRRTIIKNGGILENEVPDDVGLGESGMIQRYWISLVSEERMPEDRILEKRMPKIRNAEIADAKRLLEIYDYYVRNTAISFEYDTPSLNEFIDRMKHIMERYPYLVIELDGRIEGYTYAGALKNREAYHRSCETTIYIDRHARKNGMGRMLYEALEERLKAIGIVNLYACIGYPEEEDEYLTKNSARFHEHLGYSKAGEFHKCGYKFGRWYNILWMEKIIGEHSKADTEQEPGAR